MGYDLPNNDDFLNFGVIIPYDPEKRAFFRNSTGFTNTPIFIHHEEHSCCMDR